MRTFWRAGMVVAVIGCTAALAPPARAAERLVTIAARSCPTYEAITANRARNNIMESLEDLGRDTPYGVGGVPLVVDPAIEAAVQPDCIAIANWAFTLGTGYQTRAVTGVWGSLSKVTGPFSPTIVTEDQVPLRNAAGVPIPGSSIDGATTITLTEAQAKLAASPSKLWIQGGTPVLPITDPETYAFGALRCATDNLNGDNVEWISYPPNAVHAFCFAYYVKPAPTSGTITVVKEASLPEGGVPQRVRFAGDISYANGEFFLTASTDTPGRQSFIRAAGLTWSFREEVPPLGELTSLSCVSANGTSTSTTDADTGAASVDLGAGDTVTCTYRNRFRRPPAGLAIRKITLGAVGTFGFTVEGAEGSAEAAATTTEQGVAALAQPSDDVADLPAGTYRIEEDMPPDHGGTWALERVSCLPATPSLRRLPSEIVVPDGPGLGCTFTNRFTPAGRITLRKLTLGGVATARFQVRPEFGANRPEREQTATTTEPGATVPATGDKLAELPVGRYSIQETMAGGNTWELASVLCDGEPVASIAGRIEILLTAADPAADCVFANQRITPEPDPPDPEPPPAGPVPPPDEVGPEGGTAGTQVTSPVADLVVTKRVRPRRVQVGARVRYRITVVNRGLDAAEAVTLAEEGDPPRRGALALRTRDGSCRRRPPRYCSFGTLEPGERAVVQLTLRVRRTGRFRNVVAVNSSTGQRSRLGKRARALVVVTAPRPRFTG